MASIKVIIYDPTGSKKTPVELPNDVPMRRLIPALISKMGLPTNQGANPITYRLDHRSSGKRLSEDESLSDAGGAEDDRILIQATQHQVIIPWFSNDVFILNAAGGETPTISVLGLLT